MQIRLSGKTAVITGTSSGVGLATAVEFLNSDIGYLVCIDKNPDVPACLAERLAEEPDRIAVMVGDVSQSESHARCTELALQRTGRLDILINNAGVSVVKPLHEHDEQEWDFVMDTNVKSLYWAAKHAIPVMMQQRSGVILNSGSISGHVGIPKQGAYGPSKGALHQMTRQMAIEYASYGIRVNAIALGTVDTPIVQWSANASGDPEAFLAMLRNNHPIGRIASPEEVACFFTYLASDQASFFTGAILSMDGGFIAH
jgi:NAD(P)-dependent dehydrogenase (short-subunit alcohol dehydrogenase family)